MNAVAGSKSWQRYTIKSARRREDDGGNLYWVFGNTMHGTVNAFGLTEGSSFWNDFRYRRGSEIFGEAEPADRLYQVKSGAVRTFKLLPDGRRQIGDFHLAGDIFGVESGDAYLYGRSNRQYPRWDRQTRDSILPVFKGEHLSGRGRLEIGGQKSGTRGEPCPASRSAKRPGEDCVFSDGNGSSAGIAQTVDAADEPPRYCRLSRSYP